MDLSSTVIPKSDQLNADDLIAGPRTIKITKVEQVAGEQPVYIHYEGGTGRPYKPGKSMRRVLITIWGKDGDLYVGRRLTLYCDPEITFGPDKTGGIRISHASDITQAIEMPLTVKRGKRKPFRVEPLPAEKASAPAPQPRAIDELIAAGDAIAAGGLEALKTWWTKLLDPERALLGGHTGERMTKWKADAAAKAAA